MRWVRWDVLAALVFVVLVVWALLAVGLMVAFMSLSVSYRPGFVDCLAPAGLVLLVTQLGSSSSGGRR